MDKISEFFKEFKDRLSNPIFVSFLFAWCVINWEIVIGLVMYKNDEICLVGYSSYIDLIQKKVTFFKTFWEPLIFALLYTFGYPFIKNLIHSFDAWIKTWGERWMFKITKEGKVSMTKYLELREGSEKLVKSLEEVISKESQYRDANNTLNTELLSIKASKMDLEDKLSKWEAYNNVNILDGDWKLKKTTIITGETTTQELFIDKGSVSEYTDFARNKRVYGEIEFYNFNLNTSQMFFTIKKHNFSIRTNPTQFSDDLTSEDYILIATENLDTLKGHIIVSKVNVEFIKR